MKRYKEAIFKLITETSTNLPYDVKQKLTEANHQEISGTKSSFALTTIMTNIEQAAQNTGPICQDTGMPTFIINFPYKFNTCYLEEDIKESIAKATTQGILRPNSVDPLTGKNSGNNIGNHTPVIHFYPWEKNFMEIKLLLKGGGCENKNQQYSLPYDLSYLGKAGRDIEGVRKCILHSIYSAQGQGCSAGFIGVCIGGDRTSGYEGAKEQLFRKCHDVNPNHSLEKLENYIIEKANTLGIGTMGFGGEITLLGCKIGTRNRIPASFFVSIAYNCWAFRRQGIRLDISTGNIINWLYKKEGNEKKNEKINEKKNEKINEKKNEKINEKKNEKIKETTTQSTMQITSYENKATNIQQTQKVIKLQTPLTEEAILKLKIGDVVLLNGPIYTGRDSLHKHLINHHSPYNLQNGVIYHCGPVALKNLEIDKQTKDQWLIKAAGPTTSIREEPYQADIIAKFGIRAVIGKGGMGTKTLAALKKHGAVYLNAIGGAAQFYANCIKQVLGVEFMEWGIPEAMWNIEVKDFPAIVTMDAHGNSLHHDVDKSSADKLKEMAEPVFKT